MKLFFSMNVESAPGPNDFGVGFYQLCSDIIKDDLLSAI